MFTNGLRSLAALGISAAKGGRNVRPGSPQNLAAMRAQQEADNAMRRMRSTKGAKASTDASAKSPTQGIQVNQSADSDQPYIPKRKNRTGSQKRKARAERRAREQEAQANAPHLGAPPLGAGPTPPPGAGPGDIQTPGLFERMRDAWGGMDMGQKAGVGLIGGALGYGAYDMATGPDEAQREAMREAFGSAQDYNEYAAMLADQGIEGGMSEAEYEGFMSDPALASQYMAGKLSV